MENFIDSLNAFTNNEYKFMLKSALLTKDADFCVLEIFYKDGIMLSLETKEKLKNFALEILPKQFTYEFKYIKNFISEERIESDFLVFMEKTFPSISYNLESVKLDGLKFEICVKIDVNSFEHAKQKHFSETVQNYFKKLYEDYDFECKITRDEVFVEDQTKLLKESYVEEDVDIFEKRKIEVSDLVPIVGEKIETPASYIIDKTSAEENVVVCGKIKLIKDIVLKPRKKKEVSEESESEQQKDESAAEEVAVESESEETSETDDGIPKYQRKMYKWTLEDFTGSIGCVFFSNKENQSKLEKLEPGSVVIVRGKLEDDKFSKGVSLMVKDIAYCSLPESFEEYIEYRKEKPFYEWIEPEKIVTYQQDNLMNFAEEKAVPEYLQNKTFVCFDFETTGLHFENGDRIIEIGAVKIENGKITEKFMSYVDPEKHIPAESSAISGIVDADVEGAPKDFEALQDFYKFTRGAILTGYNIINFDMVFLKGQGKACRWNFDNEVVDTFKIAQKYVHGVKNYKLGTIAEKLGVVLDNAHRAVFDALATAEIFVKLAENLKNE